MAVIEFGVEHGAAIDPAVSISDRIGVTARSAVQHHQQWRCAGGIIVGRNMQVIKFRGISSNGDVACHIARIAPPLPSEASCGMALAVSRPLMKIASGLLQIQAGRAMLLTALAWVDSNNKTDANKQ